MLPAYGFIVSMVFNESEAGGFWFSSLSPKECPPPPFKIAVFYSIYFILGISAVALVTPPSGILLKTRN